MGRVDLENITQLYAVYKKYSDSVSAVRQEIKGARVSEKEGGAGGCRVSDGAA